MEQEDKISISAMVNSLPHKLKKVKVKSFSCIGEKFDLPLYHHLKQRTNDKD